jgi:hypothetical protein
MGPGLWIATTACHKDFVGLAGMIACRTGFVSWVTWLV